MSHIVVHDSHGYIPFSWEDKPGVSKSKVNRNDDQCPIDIGLYVLNQTVLPLPDAAGGSTSSAKIVVHDKKIPPPPPPPPPRSMNSTPKRSISVKGLRWWQDDPFLAAYKECTKSGGDIGRKNGGSKLLRKMRIKCSCKDSSESDVRHSNLVRLPNLQSPPKDRIRRRN